MIGDATRKAGGEQRGVLSSQIAEAATARNKTRRSTSSLVIVTTHRLTAAILVVVVVARPHQAPASRSLVSPHATCRASASAFRPPPPITTSTMINTAAGQATRALVSVGPPPLRLLASAVLAAVARASSLRHSLAPRFTRSSSACSMCARAAAATWMNACQQRHARRHDQHRRALRINTRLRSLHSRLRAF